MTDDCSRGAPARDFFSPREARTWNLRAFRCVEDRCATGHAEAA